MKDELAPLVAKAKEESSTAMEGLVVALQDRLFALAIKIFWSPQDAEDATQEALVRIVTKLDSFRGESTFSTWAHRVAVNHLGAAPLERRGFNEF